MTTVVYIPSCTELSPVTIVTRLRETAAKPIKYPSPQVQAFVESDLLPEPDVSTDYDRMSSAPWPPEATKEPLDKGEKKKAKREAKKQKPLQEEMSGILVSAVPHLLRNDGLVLSISAIRSSFWSRVNANAKNPMNISPSGRPTFQEMFWSILIMTPQADLLTEPNPHSLVPYIRPISVAEKEPIISQNTNMKANHLIQYVRHTGGFLHLFRVSPSLLIALGRITKDINKSRFARYIGSRSFWPLKRRMAGIYVLLEWWAATHPVILSDYQTAVSSNAEDVEQCSRLRKELCKAMGLKGEKFDVQEEILTVGFDYISRMRREMMIAVKEAYESLANEAKKNPKVFFPAGPIEVKATAEYESSKHLKQVFDEMVGKDETGVSGSKPTNASSIRRKRSISPI